MGNRLCERKIKKRILDCVEVKKKKFKILIFRNFLNRIVDDIYTAYPSHF